MTTAQEKRATAKKLEDALDATTDLLKKLTQENHAQRQVMIELQKELDGRKEQNGQLIDAIIAMHRRTQVNEGAQVRLEKVRADRDALNRQLITQSQVNQERFTRERQSIFRFAKESGVDLTDYRYENRPQLTHHIDVARRMAEELKLYKPTNFLGRFFAFFVLLFG